MLRCPTFRAVITAMKTKSLDIVVQGVRYTGWSPCRYPGIIDTYLLLVFLVTVNLAVLIYVLIEQRAFDVRKDGSGADGKVRKMNGHQGKDEDLHDKSDFDGAVI